MTKINGNKIKLKKKTYKPLVVCVFYFKCHVVREREVLDFTFILLIYMFYR